MQKRADGFPRRNDLTLFTPAEKAIWDATQAVEEAGAHPLLTEAANLLQQARDKVADFVELPESDEAAFVLALAKNIVTHVGHMWRADVSEADIAQANDVVADIITQTYEARTPS